MGEGPKRVKYDGSSSSKEAPMIFYNIFLFLIGMCFTLFTLMYSKHMKNSEALVVFAIMFCIYSCIGRVMDGFNESHNINTSRILIFICISSWLITFSPNPDTYKLNAIYAFQMFSVLDGFAVLRTPQNN